MAFWGITLGRSSLSLEVEGLVSQIQEICREGQNSISWEHVDDYHLTLRFLVNPPPDIFQLMVPSLALHVRTVEPWEFSLHGLGMFERGRDGAVLWLGMDARGEERARTLAADIDRQLKEIGLEVPAQDFTPHVTIGRARCLAPSSRERLAEFHDWRSGHSVSAQCIKYMKRRRHPLPEGGIFESLKVLPFSGGEGIMNGLE